MKRFIKSLVITLLVVSNGFAQDEPMPEPLDKGRMIEKMESMKVAYLSNQLDLNTEEAERFWPVYNEYNRKRMDLRKSLMLAKRDMRRKELSEEESQKELEAQLSIQEDELMLRKEYYEKFGDILPAKKLARLEPAERQFNQEVVRQLKERRGNRMDKRRRN